TNDSRHPEPINAACATAARLASIAIWLVTTSKETCSTPRTAGCPGAVRPTIAPVRVHFDVIKTAPGETYNAGSVPAPPRQVSLVESAVHVGKCRRRGD
ncbi:hypothetical protein LSAT2_031880, partial [Lamellibrachia satsuma]